MKTPLPLPPCRLFPIFAREASRAVIFRRGPTDFTQLILWHTDSDKFEFGQWFKGRVYVRRADLSPDGTKFIYFVNKINKRNIEDKGYTYAWTAVSKPPYYTALALWPKGDCWHGGGLFEDNNTVFLNHRLERAIPHPDHFPTKLNVRPNPNATGEDEPVYSEHLTRDGWEIRQEWLIERGKYPVIYETTQPDIRVKTRASKKYLLTMTRRIDHLTYNENFEVTDFKGHSLIDTENVSWLDSDQQNRLVLFKEGKLLLAEEINNLSFHLKELADFNLQRPHTMIAPKWATHW